MQIGSGTRLGPYEIIAPVGAGGMGEVYRARDTRLGRDVAVKVLPSHLSRNPALRERFDREARAISNLSHPHICTLHDLGHQDGIDYLVMEFLEGETLADRIARGPLPLKDVIRYGAEIADALHHAHRQGIVHRDLKPGNVMMTRAGAKVLDFGLARYTTRETAYGTRDDTSRETEQRPITEEGTILGTIQYMAPEQLEGKEADQRTDIFALGALLYEMVTGRRAFEGKSKASLIASIMDQEPPPISTLQPMTPPALDRIVRTCLEKDPDERWQSAHDIARELQWSSQETSQTGMRAVRPRRRHLLPWAIAAASLVIAAAMAFLAFRRPSAAGADPIRLMVVSPPEITSMHNSSVSPDGKFLAFTGAIADGRARLWLRRLSSATAQPVAGTEGAYAPFWSPDSRSIGFFAAGKLKRIDVSGGAAQILCDASGGAGGGWNRNGVIIFNADSVINRVAAAGGKPEPVTKLDPAMRHTAHLWPAFLPDGNHFVYLADADRTEDHGLWVGSLDRSAPKLIAEAVISNPSYAAPGFLLFVQRGVLMARPFDAKKIAATGDAFPLADRIAGGDNHYFDYSVSDAGVLTYRPGTTESQLLWMSRDGKELWSFPLTADYVDLALAPDDRHVILEAVDAERRNGDLWRLDLNRGTMSRFTFDPAWDMRPLWTPDGTHVVFSSTRLGEPLLYRKRASGSGAEEQFVNTRRPVFPTAWSPDGKYLATEAFTPGISNPDLIVFEVANGKPIPISAAREFAEAYGQFSPDGRWITYVSNESGTAEVYVQPFPPTSAKWQISSGGGFEPRWAPDGKELFYLVDGQKFFSVEVSTDSEFSAGVPRPLFDRRAKTMIGRYAYAVSSDGKRFLINAESSALSPITVVLNWAAGVRAR